MNINDVVNEQMKALCDSGEIESMVKSALTSCVQQAVEDQLCRYSSPVKKQLEEAIKESVKIDISKINLSEMMSFINNHAVAKLREVISEESSNRFIEEVNQLIKPLPDSMSATELVERIISLWNDEDDKEDWSDSYDVELEEGVGVMSNSYNLSVKVNNKSTYSSRTEKEIDLYISESNGKHQIRISHRMRLNPTCLHDEAEQLIYRMYCQGVQITNLDDFDVDDIDKEVQCKDFY
jgi:hypothetical protein